PAPREPGPAAVSRPPSRRRTTPAGPASTLRPPLPPRAAAPRLVLKPAWTPPDVAGAAWLGRTNHGLRSMGPCPAPAAQDFPDALSGRGASSGPGLCDQHRRPGRERPPGPHAVSRDSGRRPVTALRPTAPSDPRSPSAGRLL